MLANKGISGVKFISWIKFRFIRQTYLRNKEVFQIFHLEATEKAELVKFFVPKASGPELGLAATKQDYQVWYHRSTTTVLVIGDRQSLELTGYPA